MYSFDKPEWRQKEGKYDPWWFTVTISRYIIIFFYENDTNEIKGSYHDDCLKKEKTHTKTTTTTKKKKKKHICILNWGMGVSCSRNMNFVKCRVSETSGKIFSMFDNFCIFCAFLHRGLFCWSGWVDKTHPTIFWFSCSDPPPLTQQYFFLTLPLKITPTPINKWLVP